MRLEIISRDPIQVDVLTGVAARAGWSVQTARSIGAFLAHDHRVDAILVDTETVDEETRTQLARLADRVGAERVFLLAEWVEGVLPSTENLRIQSLELKPVDPYHLLRTIQASLPMPQPTLLSAMTKQLQGWGRATRGRSAASTAGVASRLSAVRGLRVRSRSILGNSFALTAGAVAAGVLTIVVAGSMVGTTIFAPPALSTEPEELTSYVGPSSPEPVTVPDDTSGGGATTPTETPPIATPALPEFAAAATPTSPVTVSPDPVTVSPDPISNGPTVEAPSPTGDSTPPGDAPTEEAAPPAPAPTAETPVIPPPAEAPSGTGSGTAAQVDDAELALTEGQREEVVGFLQGEVARLSMPEEDELDSVGDTLRTIIDDEVENADATTPREDVLTAIEDQVREFFTTGPGSELLD